MPPPPVPGPSSSASSSSSLSLGSLSSADVRIAKALEERRRRQQGTPRLYENRPHIYAKQHKELVKEAHKLDFEKTRKEIFEMKRRSGYSSSEEEFRRYLDYKEAVDRIYNRDLLASSPSVPNLRAYYAKDEARRRSETFSEGFLRRELQRARAALAEPKLVPFIPSYEQQERWKRERDEKINARLRPKRKPLPASLPPDDEANVDQLMRKRGVVAKFAREQVSDQDLSRLRPGQWLNDEVINFYGAMILGRSEAAAKNKGKENGAVNGAAGKKPLNIHYFNSFFWSKLVNEGYEKGRLARWTKKIDLFSKDVVIMPINHSNTHWTSAAINFRRKRIEYYDSLGSRSTMVYKTLRAYVDAEHRNKKKKPFDFTGWEDFFDDSAPQQENAFDCGVFSCQFMEAISRGEETWSFEQKNMPYLRRRMIWEIGNAKLRDDH
ncbi:hypothetical protein BD626DRAFT_77397 [Schizophyllum amplum]|uniref:Ubiquitin-like protease family profile domain-containing protein n=1 Tax=Schizophyllum amplum TaxID=97359 RepID=A0A550C9E2_9AGAR|nr:hypothetical protein BD626DRAFT_77397 [Auriculariopsis ampla]